VNLVTLPERYDFTWTMFILEAAPLLKELYMTVWDHPCIMETDEERKNCIARTGIWSGARLQLISNTTIWSHLSYFASNLMITW
jgi:hypothetical protein